MDVWFKLSFINQIKNQNNLTPFQKLKIKSLFIESASEL